MALKKITVITDRQANSENSGIYIDTGYTVPHGKVFIVSNLNGCVFANNRINQSNDFNCFACSNSHKGNAVGFNGNLNYREQAKGFIFTGGERIVFGFNYSRLGYNHTLYGNICGEEIPAG